MKVDGWENANQSLVGTARPTENANQSPIGATGI